MFQPSGQSLWSCQARLLLAFIPFCTFTNLLETTEAFCGPCPPDARRDFVTVAEQNAHQTRAGFSTVLKYKLCATLRALYTQAWCCLYNQTLRSKSDCGIDDQVFVQCSAFLSFVEKIYINNELHFCHLRDMCNRISDSERCCSICGCRIRLAL